jgi:hypothetical protein
MLIEDTGSAEEADALLPTVTRLSAWRAPEPAPQETARLVTRLAPVLPAESGISRLKHCWPLLILRAQLRVVRGEIWAASLLIMLLGTLVTLSMYDRLSPGDVLPLVWIAPIVTAIGIAYLYGPEVEPAIEIERATPASTRLVLLARLALIFVFDLGLGLAASLVLVTLDTGLTLWPLIMTWLAPMSFLSMLSFLVSVVLLDPTAAAAISLGLWMLQSLVQYALTHGAKLLFALPNLLSAEAQPWLILLAILLGGLALWIAGRSEAWLGGKNA